MRAMPSAHWCEIDEGRDFLTYEPLHYYDWVITNPPWSLYRPFMNKAMTLSDNVVFVALINAAFMKRRLHDMRDHGFSIAEIVELPQPSKPWPQTGFQLGAIHYKRGDVSRIKYGRILEVK